MLTKFGAVRTRNAKMEMVYCLPAELGVPTTSSPLKNLVLDIDYNDAVVVIHTSPGAAQLIARLLDSLGKAEGILGTIAGDDTIFTTPASGFSVRDLYEAILELLNKSFSPTSSVVVRRRHLCPLPRRFPVRLSFGKSCP